MKKEEKSVEIENKKAEVLKAFNDIGVFHKVGDKIEINNKNFDFYKQKEIQKYIKFI